ncbi:MAG: 3-phosphoshikimate 1-carboxyvinyltransferase [Tenericutes bacterium GWC2_34_14]|nr:MAG: 3-phosphoshikimate 1-carboxyvinyltransferase [Tenericutes bacterium GWC2_34_14]OHE34054.1 MAG: 3-phosphoshikimate 1-carboxyvinyltransferase [Tenericutes bacterium GWE2_34_108]OHE35384.1 MAG: 3-phosphoshikimate 1-carboxyvinyltransferase [Tenericutes bacterium GWF1_35_14]OHE38470.1 MAG: 3-phosphoshikimate 1-carboxyvinyltransferase [Tenericutes bacterium GWF2_35_184]OHE43111.1 MAG: 3-phosphoshikimate 1-carboxyvinyltransferase [Tenericutes bacterium RIFOXYA2_FULL_36_32]OHE47027.1 MAG: 3-ph
MNVLIQPRKLKGQVDIISSKSLSHRYVIAAGLSNDVSKIENVLDSVDLKATKDALSHLGVTCVGNQIQGHGLNYDGHEVFCHESGSTLRFLIPIFMLQDKKVMFTGHGRLPERPLNVYESLFKNDYLFEKQSELELPLMVQGPLKGGTYEVRGDVSSQFISGLLFALPLAKEDSKLILTTPLTSKDYVEMTLDVLSKYGVQIIEKENMFLIKGRQRYQGINQRIEGDYSQAAFWMVAGLCGEGIDIKGLSHTSKQGDRKIVEIIQKMKGKMTFDALTETYHVYPSATYATTIDLEHVPDLGPILMVLAARSVGTTHFNGISRLRIKESDRMEAMIQALTQLGVIVKVKDDEAWITGVKSFKGGITLEGFSDHRIVMALAVASQIADQSINITTAEAVSKSYPTFFDVFKRLGGVIDESK